jgi:anti-sigma factor RsiW
MLSPYVDGELSPSDRVNVERHLAACKECTGRAADLRATSGLVRIGMDFAADDVDWKDFNQKVMAGLTPHKPPFGERLKASVSEMFLYQRGPLVASFATAMAVIAVAATFLLRPQTPLGYASPRMALEQVETTDAHVTPVVMTTENGDTIVWIVDRVDPPSASTSKPQDDEDDEEDATPTHEPGLEQKAPTGGAL